MKEEILKLILENLGEISSVAITLFGAWLKKKWDLRSLRKQGVLKDGKEKQE